MKPNCSIQSYAPALAAWKEFGPKEVVVTTYQAISGAGKTFKDWPEMTRISSHTSEEKKKRAKKNLCVYSEHSKTARSNWQKSQRSHASA